MTILYTFAVALAIFGIASLLGLTPQLIVDDIMDILRPRHKIRTISERIREHKPKGGLYSRLQDLQIAMETTGRGKLFPLILCTSLAGSIMGILLAGAFNNYWMAPALVVALTLVPFGYAANLIAYYKKSIQEELETALSIITTSYLRSGNITKSISESINSIKPPLRGVFDQYLHDIAVTASTKQALYQLRDRVDEPIYYEWCTTLVQCQDNRTLRDNLQPIVDKLADVRIANSLVSTQISNARFEYFGMAIFLLVSLPIMQAVVPEGFALLLTTTIGKFALGVCASALLVTYLLLRLFTRPVTFDGKGGSV